VVSAEPSEPHAARIIANTTAPTLSVLSFVIRDSLLLID